MLTKLHRAQDAHIAKLYYALARMYTGLNRLVEAEEMYIRAIDIFWKLPSERLFLDKLELELKRTYELQGKVLTPNAQGGRHK